MKSDALQASVLPRVQVFVMTLLNYVIRGGLSPVPATTEKGNGKKLVLHRELRSVRLATKTKDGHLKS